MIIIKLPINKGEKTTGLFEDFFNSYMRINEGMLLINSFTGSEKLSKCPVNITPKYVIDKIEVKGILFWKKTIVTIERI